MTVPRSIKEAQTDSWACRTGEESEHELDGCRAQGASQNDFPDLGTLTIPEHRVTPASSTNHTYQEHAQEIVKRRGGY